MNIFKRLLIIVSVFIVLLVIISFFLPTTLKIEKSITIETTNELVFNQVNELKNWRNWSAWAEKDSTIYTQLNNYSTPSNDVNATFNWKSNDDELGEGSVKIIKSLPHELIELEMNFDETEALSYWYFKPNENVVEVTFGINLNFGFNPFAKWFGLFAENYIAPDIEKGLKNLKSFSENLPKISSGLASQKEITEPQWFVGIREKIDGNKTENLHAKLFLEVNEFLNKQHIDSDLPPIVIYHFWSDSVVDIEAGLLLKDSIFFEDNRIKLNKIKPGKVVTANHYGAYDRIPETYFSINEWMRRNEVQVIGPPWEIYVVDPSVEQNPVKWITEIYFPIK